MLQTIIRADVIIQICYFGISLGAVEYLLTFLINAPLSCVLFDLPDTSACSTGPSYLSGEYTSLALWWESPAQLEGETAAWFSWTGQSYAGMSADRAVMSGHTLPQTHSTDVWERLGSRRHSVGHGWPHTPPHTPCISWVKFSSSLLLNVQWASCPSHTITCTPPFTFSSLSLLMSSHLPSFSSLFSFAKHMLNSWLGRINNYGMSYV